MKKLVSLLVAILALAVFAVPADARGHNRNHIRGYDYVSSVSQRNRNLFHNRIQQMYDNMNYGPNRYYYRYGRRSRLSSGEVFGTAAVVAGAIVLDRALERRHERNEFIAPDDFEPNMAEYQQEEPKTKEVPDKMERVATTAPVKAPAATPAYVPQPPPPSSTVTINIDPWCLLGIVAVGMVFLIVFGFGLLIVLLVR